MSGVRHVTVDDEEGELRLDRWFQRRFPQVTHGRLEKMLRKGEIRVDGGRAKSATRIGPGQVVRVPPLPDAPAPPPPSEPEISEIDAKAMRDRVLYCDEHVLAIDKPAGLASQGGSGNPRHLGQFLDALRLGRNQEPRPVHRLDKDTSGVLVLGRTAPAAAALAKAFHSRATRKLYWAAVVGRPSPERGTIRYGLVKAPGPRGEKMLCIHPDEVAKTPDAKRAVSDYAVIDGAAKRASWVALRPVTGRTHQLRAHMAEIGCPIVGDGKYAGNSQVNEGDGWGAQLGGSVSRKLHLHARELSFPHPADESRMVTVAAPLSEHMARSWMLFGWRASDAPDDPWAD